MAMIAATEAKSNSGWYCTPQKLLPSCSIAIAWTRLTALEARSSAPAGSVVDLVLVAAERIEGSLLALVQRMAPAGLGRKMRRATPISRPSGLR